MILDHHISARRPKALLIIGGIWLVLLGLWAGFDAAWWILAPIALFTVPAMIEAWRGDVARLTLDHDTLSWTSARQSGTLALSDIDHVRFDTRLDFAVNARLELITGSTLRLPIEVVPPYPVFCAALDTAGLRHERHHFGFF